MNLKSMLIAGVFGASTLMSGAAWSASTTDIQWWHAMGGRLGEVVNEIAENYNASQSEYNLIPTYKGGYEDTMTAGIAAFRAKQQPNIIQIFDAGAATIINAKGATIAVEDNFDYPTATIDQSPDNLNCNNPTVTIDANATTTGTDIVYEWNTTTGQIVSGHTSLNPVIDEGGIYQIVVTMKLVVVQISLM